MSNIQSDGGAEPMPDTWLDKLVHQHEDRARGEWCCLRDVSVRKAITQHMAADRRQTRQAVISEIRKGLPELVRRMYYPNHIAVDDGVPLKDLTALLDSMEGEQMSKEQLNPITRKQYDAWKAALEAKGYTVVTRWRPGLKSMRLGDIVLSERKS